MTYKALICDVDGTLVPNEEHGKLSRKVIDTVGKVRKRIHIGVATTRPYDMAFEAVGQLQLSGPSIVHNGAKIMDITSGIVYRQHEFAYDDLKEIYSLTKQLGEKLFHNDIIKDYLEAKDHTIAPPIFGTYVEAVEEERANVLIEAYTKIPTITAVKVPSWTLGKIDLSICPLQATKQHGILEVAEILGIKPFEMIAIGDGHNDFGMLMAAGLKVAMGNAVEDLKAIADYIAPSVEEDGAAWVIEKFILNQ